MCAGPLMDSVRREILRITMKPLTFSSGAFNRPRQLLYYVSHFMPIFSLVIDVTCFIVSFVYYDRMEDDYQ